MSVQRDLGWAPGYVEAMWMMLQQDKSDDYVIATRQTFSSQNFVEEVFSRLDMAWRECVEHNPQLIRPTDYNALVQIQKRLASNLAGRLAIHA